MRANEFIHILKEDVVNEGGKSSAVRYNSELACLAAFAGVNSIDEIPDSSLANPEKTKKEIAKVAEFYNEKIFDRWLRLSNIYKTAIQKHQGSLPTKFDWVAGENAGEVSDLVFVDSATSGISIKDQGGITLSNLTPKALGLEPPRGVDVLAHYAEREFNNFKQEVFKKVIAIAKSQPGQPVNDRYTVQFNQEENNFTIEAKKTYTMTEEQIFQNISKNAPWQRPFGDWYQANFAQEKDLMKDLVGRVSIVLTEQMSEALEDSAKLKRVLQFEDKPYYYASPKVLFYVPTAEEAGDIKLKSIEYANPNGTSFLFRANIGRADNNDPKDVTVVDIYIRSANGLFAANTTARVQSIKNPQHVAWEQLL